MAGSGGQSAGRTGEPGQPDGRIVDLLGRSDSFSVELWPPRTPEATARLERALGEIVPLGPAFTTITYGAGGSTRDRTHDLVVRLHREGSVSMAHLTCAAHTRGELVDILERYRDEGVANILALKGDPPLDSPGPLPAGELAHAVELAELAKEAGDFCVAVAAHPEGHPEAPDIATDRRHLVEKMRIADFAVTQFFFDVGAYLSLVDDLSAAGISKPVLPGIMPITKFGVVARMAQLSGTTVPTPLAARLEQVAGDGAAVRRIGVEVAVDLGARLIEEGVPGLHFYTMNDAAATVEIVHALGLGNAAALPEPPASGA